MSMDIESFTILTSRGKGKAHVETKVVIDWNGITVEQLHVLARNSLIHDLQLRIREEKLKGEMAQSAILIAKDEVYEPNPARLKLMPPRPKAEKEALLEDKMTELLKMLSPEELKTLLES